MITPTEIGKICDLFIKQFNTITDVYSGRSGVNSGAEVIYLF